MKPKINLISVLLLMIIFLTACPFSDPNFTENSETEYKPLLMKRDVLENSVTYTEKREITNPGKIYVKGKYLYIVEKYEGIHIINNTDPANPVNKGFITVPGCIDIAMKGKILYADNAVDLVSIEINEDATKAELKHRNKNVFPEPLPPDAGWLPSFERPENTIIIGWEKRN